MFTGENRRRIVTISIIAAIFLIWIFLDKSGVFKSTNLPTGNEWYFNLLDLILPLTVFGLAVWKKQKTMAAATGLVLLSTFVEVCVKVGYLENFWYYGSLVLVFAGCTVFLWQAFGQRQTVPWAKWLGLIPALSGLAILFLFPLDNGFYSVLLAILSALIAFGASAMCFLDRGEVLAFAPFLLMAFKFAGFANAWIAWLTPLFAAAGFFLIGYSIAVADREGVDSLQ